MGGAGILPLSLRCHLFFCLLVVLECQPRSSTEMPSPGSKQRTPCAAEETLGNHEVHERLRLGQGKTRMRKML